MLCLSYLGMAKVGYCPNKITTSYWRKSEKLLTRRKAKQKEFHQLIKSEILQCGDVKELIRKPKTPTDTHCTTLQLRTHMISSGELTQQMAMQWGTECCRNRAISMPTSHPKL
ncbi:hypothetical protein LOD99_6177 [Oopsacas minuta]|uniref:Uncharacterized protein n=1 Tax=Oopsacas minuta TaxID=111878 RepID=A0AAV7JNS2_9METZ|nr:hypothetical protein LOD99_6177 [Oopsacas minuta]